MVSWSVGMQQAVVLRARGVPALVSLLLVYAHTAVGRMPCEAASNAAIRKVPGLAIQQASSQALRSKHGQQAQAQQPVLAGRGPTCAAACAYARLTDCALSPLTAASSALSSPGAEALMSLSSLAARERMKRATPTWGQAHAADSG